MHFPSRCAKRKRMSTGCSWPWCQEVSRLSFTTAALTPLWGHTEICKSEYKPSYCAAVLLNVLVKWSTKNKSFYYRHVSKLQIITFQCYKIKVCVWQKLFCLKMLLVSFPTAPASWPPAAGCYSSPLPTALQLGSLQRRQAVPPAHQGCPARAPATFQAQWGPQTHREAKYGHWTPTSTPAEQPPRPRFRRHLLCRIPLLRTLSRQVNCRCPHRWNEMYY